MTITKHVDNDTVNCPLSQNLTKNEDLRTPIYNLAHFLFSDTTKRIERNKYKEDKTEENTFFHQSFYQNTQIVMNHIFILLLKNHNIWILQSVLNP
jgi:hypothetical protein